MPKPTLIDAVFVPQLSRAITQWLNDISHLGPDQTVPDFRFEIPGLSLGKARIPTPHTDDDTYVMDLHIGAFLGSLDKAFQTDVGLALPRLTFTERLAVLILSDICLPILNFCAALETMKDDRGHRHLSRLAVRARAFEFQTGLLKHFVLALGKTGETAPPCSPHREK